MIQSSLYQQVKEYILSAWSRGCITNDIGHFLAARNGHYIIHFEHKPGSTPFLEISVDNGAIMEDSTLFNGYIRNIDDFKLILELTSVQKQKT